MRDCGCHSQLSQGPQRREVILNQCEAVGGALTAWTISYSIMTATCSTSQSYFHELVVPPLSHASDLTQLLNFSGSAAVVRPLEHNGRQRLFCKSQCNDRWRSFTVGVTSSQLTELMRLNEKTPCPETTSSESDGKDGPEFTAPTTRSSASSPMRSATWSLPPQGGRRAFPDGAGRPL